MTPSNLAATQLAPCCQDPQNSKPCLRYGSPYVTTTRSRQDGFSENCQILSRIIQYNEWDQLQSRTTNIVHLSFLNYFLWFSKNNMLAQCTCHFGHSIPPLQCYTALATRGFLTAPALLQTVSGEVSPKENTAPEKSAPCRGRLHGDVGPMERTAPPSQLLECLDKCFSVGLLHFTQLNVPSPGRNVTL